MANRSAIVTKTEVTRSIAAVLSAGLRIVRIEVDHRTGRVIIFSDDEGAGGAGKANPCDRLLK